MDTTHRIKKLSQETIGQIAAGEVIERPFSIVKELVENAVDALATHIEVSIEDGGLKKIIIKDNGVGFFEQDLPLAIIKNATSKIDSAHDLQNIRTKGFRGEALNSIASVSEFEILTKRKEDAQGHKLATRGTLNPELTPAATIDGTIVSVKELFFNVPARKKFLKSPASEYSHILRTFKKIALAHPNTGFVLKKDGKPVLQLKSTQDLLVRIQDIFGLERKETLIPFEGQDGDTHIHGFASNTHQNFSRPNEIWIFVNQRWISDRALNKAVLNGYQSILMERQYPCVFLYMTMPGHTYDVNVHPTKSEVRFEKTSALFRLVQDSITQALRSHHPKQTMSFRPSKPPYHPTRQEINMLLRPALSASESSSAEASQPQARPLPFEQQAPVSTTFDKDVSEITDKDRFFSSLEVLGVLDGTYIITKSPTQLILIDQHAAHERVLYEQLFNQYTTHQMPSEQPLIPITLTLDPAQIATLDGIQGHLERVGLAVERFDEQSVIVRSHPEHMKAVHVAPFIHTLLADADAGLAPVQEDDFISHLLSTTACHSAVRAHDRLEDAEIKHLLAQMDRVRHSGYCPHGRPAFIEMDLGGLEKMFKRKV